jgi:aldehyde dehydrogenase (NAD+)
LLTKDILDKQNEYFASGETHSVSFRKEMLKRLYSAVKKHEDDICKALYADLGKSRYEAFMCEIGIALTEISYMIKHIRRFAKEKRVKTPLAQFPSRSYKKPVPYGNILIMSPWNYPFLLSVEPLANAIAAGNTAVIKPSAYSPATSAVIAEILSGIFQPEYVAGIQ